MTILLTGSSGFLGKILKKSFSSLHLVISLGRDPKNDIVCDLSNESPIIDKDIDIIIHAAGKAHVQPKTEADKQDFYDVNVTGTKHLLAALEHKPIKKMVFVSSVSVYGLEKGEMIDESTPLQGDSPYAQSKIQAEEFFIQWCKQKNIDYLVLRLPLVVGPNPLGNLAKMKKAIQKGIYVRIANGNAKKSMVLASDVGTLVLNWIGKHTGPSGIYHLTDGYNPSFYELEGKLSEHMGKKWIPTIPFYLATILGKIGDYISFLPVNSETIYKITNTFTFSDTKARRELGWKPNAVLALYDDI